MNAIFDAYKPDEIKFRLTAIMSLKDWKTIAAELDAGKKEVWSASSELRQAIRDLVLKAEKDYNYYPPEKPDDSSST